MNVRKFKLFSFLGIVSCIEHNGGGYYYIDEDTKFMDIHAHGLTGNKQPWVRLTKFPVKGDIHLYIDCGILLGP